MATVSSQKQSIQPQGRPDWHTATRAAKTFLFYRCQLRQLSEWAEAKEIAFSDCEAFKVVPLSRDYLHQRNAAVLRLL